MSHYPIRVTFPRDAGVSRWLWIVKWFLAIPHFIALVVLSIVAIPVLIGTWFSVLFTGKYPESAWNYVTGLLRWSFRVQSYTSVLSTDKYPPFTLREDPNYPAHVEFDAPNPAQRNRVSVLFRWIYIIPLALVVYLLTLDLTGPNFSPFPSWSTDTVSSDRDMVSISILDILRLAAGLSLLFTAVYPEGLYRIVTAVYRFWFRFNAYFALLTDTYPPIKFVPGAREDGPDGTQGSGATLPSPNPNRPDLPGGSYPGGGPATPNTPNVPNDPGPSDTDSPRRPSDPPTRPSA